VGCFFFTSGWAKVHDLATFTSNFQSWGIPYPAFNAALSAYTECVGGALTIAGLGMRFVSIPMIINMTVAVLSVKLKEVSGLADFVNLDEPLYALAYVWLFFAGAGGLSIDALLKVLVDAYLVSEIQTPSATEAIFPWPFKGECRTRDIQTAPRLRLAQCPEALVRLVTIKGNPGYAKI
jgi:putative oxidoreductase